MIYLSGCLPAKHDLRELLQENNCGVLLTPFSQRSIPDHHWVWAADNGCFSSRWDHRTWSSWLESRPEPHTALFAVVPDVVCDPIGTLQRWQEHYEYVAGLGYKPAFVLQDGATDQTIPWNELECLFIGGSTKYKLSNEAKQFVRQAKDLGKWVHMGRVNSKRRISLAYEWGCDSVDGTYVAFGPDVNTPRLVKMLNNGTQPVFDLAAIQK